MGIGMCSGDYENQGEKDAQLGHDRLYKETDQRWSARAYTRGYNRFYEISKQARAQAIRPRGKSVMQIMASQMLALTAPKPQKPGSHLKVWFDELA